MLEESVNNRGIKIKSRCRRQYTLGAVIQMRYRVRLVVRRGFTAASVQLETAMVDQAVERHRPSTEYHSTTADFSPVAYLAQSIYVAVAVHVAIDFDVYEDEWIAQASFATDRGLYQA